MNFTSDYYPDLAELSDSQLSDARQTVVSKMQSKFAGIDLSPGSPTGDMVVTPLAAFVAASEVAHGRFMSDLDLENVANGIIYSCDFVTKYLGNFAVYDVENLRGTGLVRLTFSSNTQQIIPRHAVFRFGNTDDYLPLLVNSDSTVLTILPAGSAHTDDGDTYVLSQTSALTWAVDIPLTGTLVTAVARGAAGTSTLSITSLSLITAAIDFLPGVPSASLSDLAKLARVAAHALTTSSRNGIKALVYHHWPETRMVSPILTGDVEMLRTVPGTAMMLQAPAADVYYRSARDLQVETQTVRLNYSEENLRDGPVSSFRGKLEFLHRPSRIVSLEWAEKAGLVQTCEIYTRNSVEGTGAELNYCGSRTEEFWVEVVPSPDPDHPGTPLITLLEDEGGRYAFFTVTYLADPLVETVAAVLESPDNAPPGVSLLVKTGPLSYVTSMNISYRKTPGTKMLLSAAAAQIEAYAKKSGYPEAFRLTAIHDIMKTAGASLVTQIDATGLITVTPASRLLLVSDPGGADIAADWYDVHSSGLPVITYTTAAEIVPDTISPFAATERTTRYMLSASNINFIEVQ